MKTVSFHRRIGHDELGDGPLSLRLVADAKVREDLAERFDLIALDSLEAALTARGDGDSIVVEGRFEAQVTQRCARSLAPVDVRVAEEFRVRFVPAAELGTVETTIDPEAEIDLEPLASDGVDLGELVAQSLSLALDPYPRSAQSEAASVTLWGEAGEAGAERANPFGVLKKLRDGS